MPGFDDLPPEWTQIPAVDPREAWTPQRVSEVLTALFNATAQAELRMRALLIQLAEAEMAYERAHVIASMDPDCPMPSRSSEITVAMRDDWIRGMEQDEFDAMRYSKLNVDIQRRYMDRLERQTSQVQSIAKGVYQAYGLPEHVSGRGGGGERW